MSKSLYETLQECCGKSPKKGLLAQNKEGVN